jgi:KaiC/GvpD/RAD55 family RecA-like ATPase/CheY-like chemotaxis protein
MDATAVPVCRPPRGFTVRARRPSPVWGVQVPYGSRTKVTYGGNETAPVTVPVLRSGVAPIDERLGGLVRGRPYLISGPTGSGKTAACLAFVAMALRDGTAAAILTQDDPRDLVAQAADLGIDLKRAATTGRFALLCYQRGFAARFARALSAEPVFDELARLMGPGAPACLAVDSVAPFLDSGTASSAGVDALAHGLERLRVTTLVTYPGDVRDHYDRRLEPLINRCAAVLHLSACGEGIGRMDVVKARQRLSSVSPVFFAIRPGRGVVPLDGDVASGDTGASNLVRRQVLLVPGIDGLSEEFTGVLDAAFAMARHPSVDPPPPEMVPPDLGAVVVAARWDAIAEAATFLRQLRHFGNRTPVILVTRGDVRSRDRARALSAGFDEVVADTVGPQEFLARATAVVRRGRSTIVPTAGRQDATSREASPNDPAAVLDEMRFRAAVKTAAAANDGEVFAVLLMNPEVGELDELATLVARTVRRGAGDVVGVVGDRVAVYLPGTRRTDARPFVRRVSDAWRRSGRRELRVVQLAYPADRERLRADLRLPASSVHTVLAE